jgi:integrase
MRGCVFERKDVKNRWWGVSWVEEISDENKKKSKKEFHITRYLNGERMTRATAYKLLSMMQGDVERGVFNIERYLSKTSDVIAALDEWLDIVEGTMSPGTYSNYRGYLKHHLKPFFEKNPIMLHEVQLDVLTKLMKSIDLKPKGRWNVMQCFHVFLDYMVRCKRIVVVPPFPRKKEYGLKDPVIHWIPEDRQMAIINAIPERHQPIFLFLKYHIRRPAEAMMLYKSDFNKRDGVFTIQRGISNGKEVDHTKTGKNHEIPCHSTFLDVMASMPNNYPFSPYLFTCLESEHKDKRYTRFIMERIWKEALSATGETIGLYAGLKHSTVCQYLNDKGYSYEEVKVITDHASIESVKKYGKIEIARKRVLLEGKVLDIKSGSDPVVQNPASGVGKTRG